MKIVEFENGKFAVRKGGWFSPFYSYIDKVTGGEWITPSYIYEYCLFDTKEEAEQFAKKYSLKAIKSWSVK